MHAYLMVHSPHSWELAGCAMVRNSRPSCSTASGFKILFLGTLGIKGPPTMQSVLAPEEKCVIWARFCMPIHTGVFVNANWLASQPLKWNTASQTHHALFVIQ